MARRNGRTSDVKLGLAAIDVEIPKQLSDIADEHPICLADVLGYGPGVGNIKVKASGWRLNRAVLAMVGNNPLMFRELKRSGEYSFNLFKNPELFRQVDGCAPSEMPLRLSIFYGDDLSQGRLMLACTDMALADCRQGFGFTEVKIVTRETGKRLLRFDAPTLCSLHIEFRRKAGSMVIAEVEVDEGATEAPLPREIVRLLDTGKSPIAQFAPLSWFGDPEYEYATSMTLNR